MTVILLFLLIVASVAVWWLLQQGLMTKPWLETGVDTVQPGSDRMRPQLAKIGLGIFLVVVGSLFALFLSAYFIRMAYADWRPVPLPQLVWISTGQLIVSSVLLQIGVIAARNCDRIIVLDAGRISQQGTHDELVVEEGFYRRIFEQQDQV